VQTIGGGNPNLKPEIADTVTGGIVLQPTFGFLKGFRASLDYFSIEMTSVIGSVSTNDTINRCFTGVNKALCNNIVFDKTAFGIFSVSSLSYNQASLETHGYDLEVSYRVPMDALHLPGNLTIRDLTTFTRSLKVGDGTVVVQKAGYAYGGMPNYTGQLIFSYDLARFSGVLTMRYFDNFRWDPSLIGPDQAGYDPKASNSINRNLFPGQALFNIAASYNLVDSGTRRLQIFANINNIFNRFPPPQAGIALNLNGQQMYDTVGRYYRAGIRFTY
jgi:outer membrane receptor protein involved in Fe transport